MAWFQDLARNLGTQNAPFGFAPVGSPSQGAVDPAYNAGMDMIGNIGMGMLASGSRNPLQAFGRSYLGAQEQAQQQNKNQYIAAEMMSAAEEKKQKRQEEAAAKAERDAFLKTLPPDVQMKARSIPGYLDSYIEATDPNLQQPAKVGYHEINGKLVDDNGNVVYDGGPSNGMAADVEGRKAAADQLGLTPDDPAYKSYILTGKMPREDQAPLTATDKNAILQADEAVQANSQAIDLLTSAISGKKGETLNDKAGYGWTAGPQAWLARNDPTGFFNDDTGQATTDFNNIVMNQALGSLKSIFGGNPTEGERSILLDLQASVDKTPVERKKIIERGIAAAKRRLEFNKQRAAELRGGTYYKAGGGGPVTTDDGYIIETVPEN
jgi:hypothetical protein